MDGQTDSKQEKTPLKTITKMLLDNELYFTETKDWAAL